MKALKKSLPRLIAAILLAVIALGSVVVGIIGLTARDGDYAVQKLNEMRNYTVLRLAANEIIDEIVLAAKVEARRYADEQGMTRNQKNEYANGIADAKQAECEALYADFSGMDTSNLDIATAALISAQADYYALEATEKAAYAEKYIAEYEAAATEEPIDEGAEVDAESDEIDESALEKEIKVDYSLFEPSETLTALLPAIDERAADVWAELTALLPDLKEEMREDALDSILAVTYTSGDNFETRYDRYADAGAEVIFTSSDTTKMYGVRHADELLAIGAGVFILALTVLLYSELIAFLGLPRLILILFFLFLCIVSSLYGINVMFMIGNILKRTGMYGVLALAILPGIQCGIGLNLGMTIGCIAGLMSTMLALEWNMTGWTSFGFAVLVGAIIAAPLGWAYSKLLNRLKGNEMTVSTYVGFSFVSLICIAWMLLPFVNPKVTWLLGKGLRVTHNLKTAYGNILTKLWAFEIGGITVPTGLLLFFLLCCFIMWVFSRSKTGTAMIAAGSNPRFAEASGINVDKMRTIGTILSTVIAAVGIISYSQSLGYAQLYNSPKQMGFIAASAILIGGASVSRAKVSHVIIGTFLFQGVLALGIQVANAVVSGGGLSEVMRIMISNGIILYALTQSGGEGRD